MSTGQRLRKPPVEASDLLLCDKRPRARTKIVSISSPMLGVAIVQWALEQWVA